MNKPSLQRFLNDAGQVIAWPKKHQDKEVVLSYLATKFAFDRTYTELEVNAILKSWHTFSDWPLLRRELIERGYLSRNRSGSQYCRIVIRKAN